MKKLILAFLLAITATLTVSSCADEDVTPLESGDNGGGGASEPIRPD